MDCKKSNCNGGLSPDVAAPSKVSHRFYLCPSYLLSLEYNIKPLLVEFEDNTTIGGIVNNRGDMPPIQNNLYQWMR